MVTDHGDRSVVAAEYYIVFIHGTNQYTNMTVRLPVTSGSVGDIVSYVPFSEKKKTAKYKITEATARSVLDNATSNNIMYVLFFPHNMELLRPTICYGLFLFHNMEMLHPTILCTFSSSLITWKCYFQQYMLCSLLQYG